MRTKKGLKDQLDIKIRFVYGVIIALLLLSVYVSFAYYNQEVRRFNQEKFALQTVWSAHQQKINQIQK